MKKIIKLSLILLFLSILTTQAQNVPLSGSFTVNGQTFNCSSWSPLHNPNGVDKVLVIDNASNPVSVPPTAFSSSTCTTALNSLEITKYSYAKNRENTLQLVGFLKTVFPLARANQLGRKYFGIDVVINPSNNNSILYISYTTLTAGTNTDVTQQELAQLDALIRTSTFVFPKVSGICNNVSALSLRGIDFKFDELYIKPRFSGIDTMFD